MSLIVYIEGNIGAGKSTVISKLRNMFDQDKCLVMTELVSNWPSLKPFYENKRKYAYKLQTEVMESSHDRETKYMNKEMYVLERSLLSSLYVFAKLNCTNDEIFRLAQVYRTLGRVNVVGSMTRTMYIYIRTPAKVCLEYIIGRQKPTDRYIDIDYLQKLEKMHDEVFVPMENAIVVNDDQDVEEVVARVKRVIDSFAA